MTRLSAAAVAVVIALTSPAMGAGPPEPETPAVLIPARDKIKAQDFAGAIPLLRAVIEADPGNADALSMLGFSPRKSGVRDEAFVTYGRALQADPKHVGTHEYLGELYAETGNVAKAKEHLTVLHRLCGQSCEEALDLAAAIAQAERK